MLSISIHKRLLGFTLDVAWQSAAPIVALVGPSGAGKTLTLQCLAGLLTPDRGRIALDDRLWFERGHSGTTVDVPPRHRRVGYVFQGYALFPHLSVARNIAYGLRRWSRERRAARVRALCERFRLEGLGQRSPFELSGGQQQRVALARALAIDPDLLLLDEPLSALDVRLRRELRKDLSAALRASGKPVVLVTHDLAEAYQLADEVVLYEEGRVAEVAPKAQLLWRPTSERVARLIGARNLLRGAVLEATPEHVRLTWRGHVLDAVNSPVHPYQPAAGLPVAFFIRPEYVRLVRKDRPLPELDRPRNRLAGCIVDEEDEGTHWRLFLTLEGSGPPAQEGFDLEIEVPKVTYESLNLGRNRDWQVTIHPSSIHILPLE